MRHTPHLLILATLAFLLATSACSLGEKDPTATYTLPQLQHDYDQYTNLIRKHHPKTFTDILSLEQSITDRRELLAEGMTDKDLYRIVTPIGARVMCGHTRTYLSEPSQTHLKAHGQCLPLEIKIIDNQLYAYKDFTPNNSIPRGSTILSIDNHESKQIITRLRESLPADGNNVTYKDYRANLKFSRLYTILFGGALQFELTIQEPGIHEPRTVTVQAMPPDQADQINDQRYPSDPEPERLTTAFSEDNRYAILTIRDFCYYDDPDIFRIPIAEFFAKLKQAGTPALILDVRGNDGGDPYSSSSIANHVINKPVQYFASGTPFYNDLVVPIPVPQIVFTGELFVLTDGWCFSSTGHLCALLRCHHRGVFVGEETGGSTACNDASKMFELKHTGLRLNLPRRTFAVAATCLPLAGGIPPDHHVQPTIEDLIAGRDVVLEKAISLIGEN